MHSNPATRIFFRVAAGLIFVFLYAPIAVLVAFSFQQSSILSWPIETWSLRWYAALLENRQIQESILNSLTVASACVVVTTLTGVPLALALRRIKGNFARLLERTILMPLIVPQLITGLALLLIRTGPAFSCPC